MSGAADREIVITRLLKAPRELVWKAFTDPKHVHSIDVRWGGIWLFDMHGPGGTVCPNRIAHTEVRKPERLAFQHDSGEASDPSSFEVVTIDKLERYLVTM
jgi:uncharacterized protein YndB with AHSA1/START domain